MPSEYESRRAQHRNRLERHHRWKEADVARNLIVALIVQHNGVAKDVGGRWREEEGSQSVKENARPTGNSVFSHRGKLQSLLSLSGLRSEKGTGAKIGRDLKDETEGKDRAARHARHGQGRRFDGCTTGTARHPTSLKEHLTVLLRENTQTWPFSLENMGHFPLSTYLLENVLNKTRGKICTQDLGSLEKQECRHSWICCAKIRRPSTSVDGRDFDGRRFEKPSRYRPVEKLPEPLTERIGYPSYGTRRTGATGTACSPRQRPERETNREMSNIDKEKGAVLVEERRKNEGRS
ncbi:hypothetical protein K438DRAFT_2154453 [Mycena galopus ATCC 62051]|nr:hypothetical protein K438DRAFT_2154453 [Mycena galopus ATCC 62051]